MTVGFGVVLLFILVFIAASVFKMVTLMVDVLDTLTQIKYELRQQNDPWEKDK